MKKFACSYSLGLFFSNIFEEEVELLKVKQTLSGLQVITFLDWIKKEFKIIGTCYGFRDFLLKASVFLILGKAFNCYLLLINLSTKCLLYCNFLPQHLRHMMHV